MASDRARLLDPSTPPHERSLYGADDDLRNDKEVVLYLVKCEGSQLEWASDALKNDLEVAMAAVLSPSQYNGSALQHAAEPMRNSKQVVLAAISGYDGQALSHASKSLQGDMEVVRAAMTQSAPDRKPAPIAIQYVDFTEGILAREDQEEVLNLFLDSDQYDDEVMADTFPAWAKDDQDIMCKCSAASLRRQKKSALDFIDDEDDFNAGMVGSFPDWAKEDQDIMSKCCAKDAKCIREVSDTLAANKEFILSLFKANPEKAWDIFCEGKYHGDEERAAGHVFEDPDVVAAAGQYHAENKNNE
jgi:hypothetical protein